MSLNICDNCGCESEYLREDEHGDNICDTCYSDKYEDICTICEETYNKPTCPEETFFVLSKKTGVGLEMKGGVYRVLSWPYTVNCLIGGFQNFNPRSVELMKEIDINSIQRQLYKHKNSIDGGEICQDCAKLYSMEENFFSIRNTYCDPFYRLHYNILKRGAIQKGK